MSEVTFNAMLNEVDSFSYNQVVALLSRLIQVLQSWTPCDRSDDVFYSPSNVAHIERGIKALRDGKGEEHELIEVD